jgi:hypothetical protein
MKIYNISNYPMSNGTYKLPTSFCRKIESNARHHTLDSTLVTPHFHLLHHLTHFMPYIKQNRSSMFSACMKISLLNKKTVIAYQLIKLLPWSSLGNTTPSTVPALYGNTHLLTLTLFSTNLIEPDGSATSDHQLYCQRLSTNISFHRLIRRWQHKTITGYQYIVLPISCRWHSCTTAHTATWWKLFNL